MLKGIKIIGGRKESKNKLAFSIPKWIKLAYWWYSDTDLLVLQSIDLQSKCKKNSAFYCCTSVSVEVLGWQEVGRRCRHTPTQWYSFPLLLHRMLLAYTRVRHTHTQTQKLTPNRKSTRDAFIDFTAVDFSYEKKPQNSLYIRITCWISAAICGTCNCQKTGKDMGNKWWNLVFFFFFLQRLHTLSCLAYALICDNFYSPWLYLLKHFHLW